MDVVAGQPELVEVPAHCLGRDSELAEGRHRRPLGPLRELLAVVSEDQAVVDVLRRRRPERFVQLPVEVFVRTVVVSAVDVRDPELGVVDDAREVVRGRSVLAEDRRPAEAVAAKALRGGAVELLPLALAERALVPGDVEPREVAEDRLLPTRDVARRVGVVDPQEEVIALSAVDDRAERVADMERTGRAGSEADTLHRVRSSRARRTGAVPRRAPRGSAQAACRRAA